MENKEEDMPKTEYLNIETEYKNIVDSLEKEPHYVNRDGDLFLITCPHCGSKNVGRVGIFFICAKRHIFSLYTEDGIRKESEMSEDSKKRIIGDDLDTKSMKDSHGHSKYDLFNKDDKYPMYFRLSLYGGIDYEGMTLNVAKHYLGFFKDRMNEFKNKFESLYLELSYFYTDFDEAVNGRVYYDLISRVQPMWMQKAIIIANELDKIEFGTEEIYANLFFIK
jgi:hypothetical protein